MLEHHDNYHSVATPSASTGIALRTSATTTTSSAAGEPTGGTSSSTASVAAATAAAAHAHAHGAPDASRIQSYACATIPGYRSRIIRSASARNLKDGCCGRHTLTVTSVRGYVRRTDATAPSSATGNVKIACGRLDASTASTAACATSGRTYHY